jgi:hypothetical protein
MKKLDSLEVVLGWRMSLASPAMRTSTFKADEDAKFFLTRLPSPKTNKQEKSISRFPLSPSF